MYNITWQDSSNDYQIFISNSEKDNKIAESFFALFVEGMGIPSNRIFNFSIAGQIPMGKEFHESIRNAILSTNKIAIFIISLESLKSKYCLYEMGAVWALGIIPVPIYIYPLRTGDGHFNNLPLSGNQSSNVDLRKRESIEMMLESITTLINTSITTKEYSISSFIRKKEEFINRMLSYSNNKNINISLKNGISFHQNNDASTLRAVDKSDSCIKLCIDFTNSIPEFVGYALNLNEADWSYYVEKDFSVNLNLIPLKTVRSITVEFKGKNKNPLGSKKVLFDRMDSNHISIKLRDINDCIDVWHNMTELVFLIKPDDIDEVGTIKIEDIVMSE